MPFRIPLLFSAMSFKLNLMTLSLRGAFSCYLDEENSTSTNFPGNIGFNVESKGSHNKNGF